MTKNQSFGTETAGSLARRFDNKSMFHCLSCNGLLSHPVGSTFSLQLPFNRSKEKEQEKKNQGIPGASIVQKNGAKQGQSAVFVKAQSLEITIC